MVAVRCQGAALREGASRARGRRASPPIAIVSVAHLNDEERALVLGVLLEEVLWVRTQPGSQRLRVWWRSGGWETFGGA